jgi:hypothetical protein
MEMNELIKEVAVKHGIAVGKNDPLMVLCTINQRLLQESSEEQAKLLNQFREEIELVSHRWSEDTKAKAEKIINAALAASRKELGKGMEGVLTKATEMTTKKAREAGLDIIRQAKFVAMINILGATITLVAAGIIVWSIKF